MASHGFDALDDDELIRRFATVPPTEQHAVFGVVCDRHLGAVLRFCASQLREPEASSDAAQETFLAAFEELRSGTTPRNLGAWLYGIARNRCIAQYRGAPGDGRRRRSSADLLTLTGDANRPEVDTIEDLNDLSRRRLAEVDQLLDLVASTLTENQQRLYELAIRGQLRGAALGTALGWSAKRASTETWDLIRILHDGFGALVLARDGRRYCAQLARILDTATRGPGFTPMLRERIVAHFGTCRTCDACGTCQQQRVQLTWAYTPVLIPVLVLGVTRENIDDQVRRTSAATPLPPRTPPPAPPVASTRAQERRRKLPLLPLLLVPLLVIAVIGAAVALRPGDDEALLGGSPTVLPASLAGTWELTPFNELGSPAPPTGSTWSFTGACDTPDTCAFNWLPLTGTTTFEGQFTQEFRDSAASNAEQNLPPEIPRNIPADLIVRPTPDGQAYSGRATAQYGIFDELEQTFASGQETVILTVVVLESTTDTNGRTSATRLSVNVTYAAHDFDPCASLCGRQSFDDLKRTATAVATRTT